MKFSNNEMIFLNSLSDGPVPFGLSFHMPEDKEKDRFILETIQSLQEKNIIGADGKLSKLGVIPVKILELYKNAESHVLLNHLLLCGTSDRRRICIVPDSDGYDMFCIDSTAILFMFLKESAFMQKAQQKNAPLFFPRKMKTEEWQRAASKYSGRNILACRFQGPCPVERKIFYWDDQNGYEYNFASEECKKISPREMRLCLMSMIGMKTGGA